MVSTSGGCSASNESVEQPPLRRQPLKRRSLSQFYCSKSQSFDCMQDLVKNTAFSRSALLLAKRASQSQKQTDFSFARITEDRSEPTSSQLTGSAQTSPFAGCCLQRHSWDGSQNGNPQPAVANCSLLSSLSATPEQQHQHSPPQQDLHLNRTEQELQPQLMPTKPAAWRLPVHSNADFPMEDCSGDCWSAPSSPVSDGLCAALQTASLSGPQCLLGLTSYSVPRTDRRYLVTVGAGATRH